jgi:hypothetical protein
VHWYNFIEDCIKEELRCINYMQCVRRKHGDGLISSWVIIKPGVTPPVRLSCSSSLRGISHGRVLLSHLTKGRTGIPASVQLLAACVLRTWELISWNLISEMGVLSLTYCVTISTEQSASRETGSCCTVYENRCFLVILNFFAAIYKSVRHFSLFWSNELNPQTRNVINKDTF